MTCLESGARPAWVSASSTSVSRAQRWSRPSRSFGRSPASPPTSLNASAALRPAGSCAAGRAPRRPWRCGRSRSARVVCICQEKGYGVARVFGPRFGIGPFSPVGATGSSAVLQRPPSWPFQSIPSRDTLPPTQPHQEQRQDCMPRDIPSTVSTASHPGRACSTAGLSHGRVI